MGGKKGFTEEIILELSLPERKIDTTIMKERGKHTATRNVIAKAGMNMWITISEETGKLGKVPIVA